MKIIIRHGTVTGYRNHACRCDRCRYAHSEAVARSRTAAAAKGLSPSDPRHGTLNAFDHFGCRCEACKATKAAVSKRQYLARRAVVTP